MITQKYLKECLDYYPDTGVFTWKVRPDYHFAWDDCSPQWNGRWAGVEAGNLKVCKNNTYREVCINGKKYLCHRLAWLYVHGKFPVSMIDHQDGNGLNNVISNLRSVTNKENMMNACSPKTSTTGVIGVSWNKRRSKWRSYITIDKHQKHLGYYDDFSRATEARKRAEQHHGFHPNHGRAAK